MTTTNRLLAALCYFSFFFLGFIFPAVIYFVAGDDFELKGHAKRALISHLFPVVMGIIVFFAFLTQLALSSEITALPYTAILAMFLLGLISFIVMIWNVIQGIKLVKD